MSFWFLQDLINLPFFDDANNVPKWPGYIAAALTCLGAIFLSTATFYHCQTVWVTKNTAGLAVKFMVFSCGTAILMSFCSLTGLIGNVSGSSIAYEWAVIDSCFIFVNMSSLVANAYTYKQKKENMLAAEEAGMTEQDYYNRVILPSLDLKN